MNKRSEDLIFSGISPEKLQFGCLALVAVVDFLMVTVFILDPWIFTFPVENYLMIPAVAFVAASLMTKLSREALRKFTIGGIMVVLLALSQWLQYMKVEKPGNISMWWTVYLLAFPFAAVMKDREQQKGLRIVGMTAVAAASVSCLYTVLMMLGILPGFLGRSVRWDGEGRLQTMNHPLVSGWLFMIGIAFCIGFFFRTKDKRLRWGLAIAAAVQFVMQSLTNSRAPSLVTCAIIAGAGFFYFFRGGWKRCLLGLVAAAMVAIALFVVTDFIYDKNHDRLAAESVAEQVEQMADLTQKADQMPSAPPQSTVGTRNTFLQDLKNLTGRSVIWGDAFNSLRENPQYLLWGTADIPAALPTWHNPHAHNAWIQVLLGFGIPALLVALWFTFLAARGALVILFSGRVDLWQKTVAMLVGAMLIAGIMEPFLFTAYYPNHFFTVVFMLCIGYLDEWRLELKRTKAVK